jgi:hypothetical protein
MVLPQDPLRVDNRGFALQLVFSTRILDYSIGRYLVLSSSMV